MPSFSVSRSRAIAAPREEVFATIRDFRTWPRFSPWLVAEPGARLEFSEDGRTYSWEGAIVGKGTIEVVDEEAPARIDYRITFLRPFRSVASVGFRCAEREGGTEVTWTMDGGMPFFLFWMTGTMADLIGSDYERGLAMLKGYVERGTVLPPLEFGDTRYKGCTLAGRRARCGFDEIGSSMEREMGELASRLGDAGLRFAGPPLSIYHRWDMGRRRAEYTIGVPLADSEASLPEGVAKASIPALDAYTVTFTGPYEHLGNAWSAGYAHRQAKQFRPRRDVDPFEIYVNDPAEVDEKELVTVVHFPRK